MGEARETIQSNDLPCAEAYVVVMVLLRNWLVEQYILDNGTDRPAGRRSRYPTIEEVILCAVEGGRSTGSKNRQIAERLVITEATVKDPPSPHLHLLGVNGRVARWLRASKAVYSSRVTNWARTIRQIRPMRV